MTSRTPGISSDWFKDCTTEEERKHRAELLTSSPPLLRIICQILESRTDSTNDKLSDYDTPAWMYRLAHKNGQKEERDYVLKLLRPLVSK